MYVRIIKPFLDRLLSLVFILLFFWLYIVIALLVRVNLGSPVLFVQYRPGKKDPRTGEEKIFKLRKFRTMTDAMDEAGNLRSDDERITKFGSFLRSTSLDELPELLWNVLLRYDMSLVGPRPQLVLDMVFMSDEQRRRHDVMPGLTGLAQVNGRNDISWEKKLEWDLEYVDNISFWSDVKIIWATVATVFKRTGITDGKSSSAPNYCDVLLDEGIITGEEYKMGNERARFILNKCDKPILIHEVHDLWPATLYEVGGMSKKHPFVQVLQMAENSAYKHSDEVVSILPKTREYMTGHGLREDKFHYIPNGIALEEWEDSEALPIDIENSLQNLKKDGNFIVGYFGGHARSNYLDILLDSAKQVAKDQTDRKITFVMVGDGVEKPRLKSRVESEHIDNVLMFDSVPKTCIPRLLELFDCVFICIIDSPLYKYGLSLNKFFDAMMSAKPVLLSTNVKDTVVESAGCGMIVPAEKTDLIVNALKKLSAMTEEERTELGEKGRREMIAGYTYDKLAVEFEQIMKPCGDSMNILYINHYAGTPELGMEFRSYYLAREWVKRGHHVDIIAADYSHLRKKNPEVDKDFEEELIDGINFHWVKTGNYSGNGIKRAITMFKFAGKVYMNAPGIAKRMKPDVIITSSTYPLDTYAGQRIKKHVR